MFNPSPSATGIAPLNSTIGNILINATIIYFTISGKLDIDFLLSILSILSFLYFTINIKNCLYVCYNLL